MLVDLKYVLKLADEGEFCVPAFNVYNLETAMGVIAAAEESRAPVILQIYPRLFREGSGSYVAKCALEAARLASVPVCLHLDHGPSEEEVLMALRSGATGIMLDGSSHPYEENVALTRRIVDLCAKVGVPVEGELGHIGSVNDAEMDEFTNVEEAADFAKATGVSCLAVLVGNAHGYYKKPPKLDIDRIAAIHQATGGLPLVLHGGSGIPDAEVKAAIKAGIRKMNIGTDVCYAFINGTKEALETMTSYAVDLLMKPAIASVKRLALEKIRLVGAEGRIG